MTALPDPLHQADPRPSFAGAFIAAIVFAAIFLFVWPDLRAWALGEPPVTGLGDAIVLPPQCPLPARDGEEISVRLKRVGAELRVRDCTAPRPTWMPGARR